MHATITLSGLSFTTADGHSLFNNIDAAFGPGLTGLVGRNGAGKTTLLKLIAGEIAPSSGTVSVAGRLALFDQTVRPKAGETLADCFAITAMLEMIREAGEGRASVETMGRIDWLAEEKAVAALSRFAIAYPLTTPLVSLSGGELTRARLAALIYDDPDFILLDEPTNNLDAAGRKLLMGFLGGWRGGALVVSHDRELLEEMTEIAELTSLGITRYGGNYSFYEREKAAEIENRERRLSEAEREVRQASAAARQRAERKARTDAKGRKARKRNDMPKMVLDGMKAQSEATAARQNALKERQAEKAAEALSEAKARLEVVAPFAVTLPPSGLAAGRRVLKADRLAGGYDAEAPLFRDFSFEMTGPERVAIEGGNGAGKSTLVKTLAGGLRPLGGAAEICVPFALFDQAVSMLEPAASVRENFRRLNPHDGENACRAALARFRFRADEALKRVAELSGGELLRAGLAVAVGGTRPAQLLILDEPTNHLDLESLATLEAGLNAYDGALLVISHDRVFLERIGIATRIALSGDGAIRR
ncbi:ABC-F family ATP-binding cassette domain-containing protein [Martelella radicis]|uniref:ATPase subunit of ABC transporter with duplicated ATPase domains n=1 Tax=Martelella radicis TaxID=1397476 RepID=A0A7W6PBK7_9HYPH|nr:ABC-F family ATP-binding cassette domain-containing protein [Martelella radicis]MBB4124000.1 ATPase subunit of ABC transporter with duplicated ATPase domains [Martelella radicis]